MSDFQYEVSRESLEPALASVFVELHEDRELTDFIQYCMEHPHTLMELTLLPLLCVFMTAYEAHGVLGMYPMHLLGSAQWEMLVPQRLRGGRLLDVGAGQGFVTEYARPLFKEIVATETAKSMAVRLRARGFETCTEDITYCPELFLKKSFDVVSILNVLDRCDKPRTLLQNARSFLKDDGVLIISDPLPLSQHVRSSSKRPIENLGADTGTWEHCLNDFYINTVLPAGLTPILVSRLPYVYRNIKHEPCVVLDDFVMVCAKLPEASPIESTLPPR